MAKIRLFLCFILLFIWQFASADDVFVYMLLYGGEKGTVVYCGITNDPEARALEHATNETMRHNTFDTMLVIAGPVSRAEALKLETECIYKHEIPRLYQTYPKDYYRPSDLNEKKRDKAIKKYESRYDTSRLIQTLKPKVLYYDEVLGNIEESGEEIDPICVRCGIEVIDKVFKYSLENFSQVFCRGCQSKYKGPICENCRSKISDRVFEYSFENFGTILCRSCQSKF